MVINVQLLVLLKRCSLAAPQDFTSCNQKGGIKKSICHGPEHRFVNKSLHSLVSGPKKHEGQGDFARLEDGSCPGHALALVKLASKLSFVKTLITRWKRDWILSQSRARKRGKS